MTASEALERISAQLFARTALPPLRPTEVYSASLTRNIDGLRCSPILKATLHLLNDDITKAHDIAQAHEESQTANLTHAILHRREGDFWNSKWWLSRIDHELVDSIHGGTTGAKKFVDDCERARSEPDIKSLQAKQWTELKALVDHANREEEKQA